MSFVTYKTNYMLQNSFRYWLLILSLTGLIIPQVGAKLKHDYVKDEPEAIIIRPSNDLPPETPRSVDTPSIDAYYYQSISMIGFNLSNCGDEVRVYIVNTSTGVFYADCISGEGNSLVSICGEEGVWAIVLMLSTGSIYEGLLLI